METKFSNYFTVFRKKPQQTIRTTKNDRKPENIVKKINKIDVIIMDISKAFGTLNYNLFVAKCKLYGFDLKAASFIKSYLKNRYQHCKIGESFSE